MSRVTAAALTGATSKVIFLVNLRDTCGGGAQSYVYGLLHISGTTHQRKNECVETHDPNKSTRNCPLLHFKHFITDKRKQKKYL